MSWRIGVDIGGTFTDVAVADADTGAIAVVKVPTTPRDIADGVLEALHKSMARHGVDPSAVTLLSHATTVVTNALLEEKGARIALVATAGFRDLLELRRSSRSHLYDLQQDPPAVLVPRHRRFEVTERIDAQGEVVEPLDEAGLDGIIEEIKRSEAEAVAVSLLFSFLNDDHERRVGEHLRAALPDLPIFLSSEVLPEVREFERTSTTAVCAYVGPILASYLDRLEAALNQAGLPPLHIMTSSGGIVDVAEALAMPAMVVESGPAAGVIATAFVGEQLDMPNLLSFDMGGTTAKASLIRDGQVEVTSEYEVGGEGNVNRWLHGTGHPIRVPVVDLAEVSAGGGSIAWIDAGGALRVGPFSAGAEPGPVCYGRGGDRPTVTDCDLVLGFLSPDRFVGGDLKIDAEAARVAIDKSLAGPLGISVEEAAAGVVDVVNNNMADALRIVSVERGHDPRGFNLVAFGGAGPVHAASIAAAVDCPRVVIPPIPGGFSALGLLVTDLQRDYARTFYERLDRATPDAVGAVLGDMEKAGQAMLESAGAPPETQAFRRSADLRYVRQAYELSVPLDDGPVTADSLERLGQRFHERHRQTYGHDNPDEAVQIVNLRLSAIGRRSRLEMAPDDSGEKNLEAARTGTRAVFFPGLGPLDCAVFDRDRLPAEGAFAGPAIVEAPDTTITVPRGWMVTIDRRGFLVLEAPAHE